MNVVIRLETDKPVKIYKYHKCLIAKIPMDLGEDDARLNYIYRVYENPIPLIHIWKSDCVTLSNAKEYIDSGFNDNYLG